ncbi:hypothetical protein TorRG33x02_319620 [Trema orientale]|uniref:Uncharacterized protein n=1 Tax=Trema orientale TaxID=63057 RepID=A0A2P5BIN6_TREOI|nr:hypothetical protein TorRG33x02_319620 [Trema orientale]
MDGCMLCSLFDLSSLDYYMRSDKDVGLEKKVVAGFSLRICLACDNAISTKGKISPSSQRERRRQERESALAMELELK